VIIEVKSLPPKSGTNGVSERKKLMNGVETNQQNLRMKIMKNNIILKKIK